MGNIVLRFDNAMASLRRHGTWEYSRRLMAYFSRLLYKTHDATVFRCDLAHPVPELETKLPVQFATYNDLWQVELHRFLDPHLRPDITELRLKAGWRPLLALFQGRIAGLSWYSIRPVYIEGIESYLDYGQGAGYLEGTRTDDRVRGQGIAPAVYTRICNIIRDLGCSQAYVCAGDDNAASQAVSLKSGFHPYQSVRLRRFLWFRCVHRAPISYSDGPERK